MLEENGGVENAGSKILGKCLRKVGRLAKVGEMLEENVERKCWKKMLVENGGRNLALGLWSRCVLKIRKIDKKKVILKSQLLNFLE